MEIFKPILPGVDKEKALNDRTHGTIGEISGGRSAGFGDVILALEVYDILYAQL